MDSDDLEDNDLILVDLLTPTLLLPSSVQHKDLVKECVSRLELPSEKAIKLYYLIDSETLEQQNHRMAIVVQDSKFGLNYVQAMASDNELLRDRLGTALESFAVSYDELHVAKAELEVEKKKRKAAEAKVKELERALLNNKRGTV